MTADQIGVILANVEMLFEVVRDNLSPEDQKRKGGYFCITHCDSPLTPLCVVRIGGLSENKAIDYFFFSQEKAQRLLGKPEHISSWQSRSMKRKYWGGAVRCGEIVLSFSGLPDHADEALILLLLSLSIWEETGLADVLAVECFDNEYLEVVADISKNDLFYTLRGSITPVRG